MEKLENIKSLLKYIISGLVSNPESVSISSQENNNIITLSIKVSRNDMAFIIGKSGITINHIKNIISFKNAIDMPNKKIYLTIVE